MRTKDVVIGLLLLAAIGASVGAGLAFYYALVDQQFVHEVEANTPVYAEAVLEAGDGTRPVERDCKPNEVAVSAGETWRCEGDLTKPCKMGEVMVDNKLRLFICDPSNGLWSSSGKVIVFTSR